MPSSNPLLVAQAACNLGLWDCVLSVIAALIISRWPALHLQDAPVSLFLCAVILSAWSVEPGRDCSLPLYPLSPSTIPSCLRSIPWVQSPGDPTLSRVHGVSLVCRVAERCTKSAMESLRRARDDLKETVQELQRTNEALQAESRERKRAEEASRQAQADLAHVSRVTTMGELTASLAHEVNQPIGAPHQRQTPAFAGWRATPNVEEARRRP